MTTRAGLPVLLLVLCACDSCNSRNPPPSPTSSATSFDTNLVKFVTYQEDGVPPGVMVAGLYQGCVLTPPVLYRLTLLGQQKPVAFNELVGRLPQRVSYADTFKAVEYTCEGAKVTVVYRRGPPDPTHGDVSGSAYFVLALPPHLAPGKYTVEVRCAEDASRITPLSCEFTVPASLPKPTPTVLERITLTEKDNGKMVRAFVGQEILLRIKDSIQGKQEFWLEGGGSGPGGPVEMLDSGHYELNAAPGQEPRPGYFVEKYLAASPGRSSVERGWSVKGALAAQQEFRADFEVLDRPAARTAARARTGGPWGETVNGVRARLVCDQTRFIVGENIPARLDIECVRGYPEGFKTSTLRSEINFLCGKEYKTVHIPVGSYLYMQEGTTFSTEMDLREVFSPVTPGPTTKGPPRKRSPAETLSLVKPGLYTVTANQLNDLPYLADEWTGQLRTPPVTIEVLADTPENRKALQGGLGSRR